MQKHGNSAAECLDGWNTVTLHGRHQKQIRCLIELPEFSVAQVTVKVDPITEAKVRRKLLHRFKRRALAHNVKVPVDTRGEHRCLVFERLKRP